MTYEFVARSRLGAAPATVLGRMLTVTGVNDELRPIVRMTAPRGTDSLDPATVPGLAEAKGQDLVTSSGDTLLGADDKAGMAEVMTAVAHLAANPDLPRPAIRLGFTPDEEIGKGPILFDVERFGARCAYTLDGSDLGEMQAESFTGSEVVVDEGVAQLGREALDQTQAQLVDGRLDLGLRR